MGTPEYWPHGVCCCCARQLSSRQQSHIWGIALCRHHVWVDWIWGRANAGSCCKEGLWDSSCHCSLLPSQMGLHLTHAFFMLLVLLPPGTHWRPPLTYIYSSTQLGVDSCSQRKTEQQVRCVVSPVDNSTDPQEHTCLVQPNGAFLSIIAVKDTIGILQLKQTHAAQKAGNQTIMRPQSTCCNHSHKIKICLNVAWPHYIFLHKAPGFSIIIISKQNSTKVVDAELVLIMENKNNNDLPNMIADLTWLISLSHTLTQNTLLIQGSHLRLKTAFFTQKKSRLCKSENAARLLYAKNSDLTAQMRLLFSLFVFCTQQRRFVKHLPWV